MLAFIYVAVIVIALVYGATDICKSIRGLKDAVEEQTRLMKQMDPALLHEIATNTGDLRSRIGDYMRHSVYPARRDSFE